MKPISLALLCLFAMAPFLLMAGIRIDALHAASVLRAHYDEVIDNAASDAALTLARTSSGDSGYGPSVGISGNQEEAVEAFFESLSAGFAASGVESAEARIRNHVPVIVLVGPQGATLLVSVAVPDAQGHPAQQLIRLPEEPYACMTADGKTMLRFTMGEVVGVCRPGDGDAQTRSWKEWGVEVEEISTEEKFLHKRMVVVASVVRSLLEAGMSLSAEQDALPTSPFPASLASLKGAGGDPLVTSGEPFVTSGETLVTSGKEGTEVHHGAAYRFSLPDIEDAAFRRAVSDIGFIAFLEGLPIGGERKYSTFALGGGRVLKRMPVAGLDLDEGRTYCREDCATLQFLLLSSDFDPDSLRWFASPEEAAAEGYAPCQDCRP